LEAHEALLRRQPIAGWLEEEKDALQLRDDVPREAKEWADGGRHIESLTPTAPRAWTVGREDAADHIRASIRKQVSSVLAPLVWPIVIVAVMMPPPPPMMLAIRPTIVIIVVVAPVVGKVVIATVIPIPVIPVVVLAIPSQGRQGSPGECTSRGQRQDSLMHVELPSSFLPRRSSAAFQHWSEHGSRSKGAHAGTPAQVKWELRRGNS
jgi:hypothetical protein